MAELTPAGLDRMITRAREAMADRPIQVRLHGVRASRWVTEDFTAEDGEFIPGGVHHYPATESTPWVAMDGWGVPQSLPVPWDGTFDQVEFRDATSSEVLLRTGVLADRWDPVVLLAGTTITICPAFAIDGVQVLPVT